MKNKILLIQKLKVKMAFNNNHRNLASRIAVYLSNKDSEDATRISSIYVELANSIGTNNAKKLIMHYTEQIRAGVNHRYAGCHMFDKGSIHAMKQKLINTLYTRLVRELVMPIIYAYYKTEIKSGAFASMLVIPEDKDRLHGPIESDLSAAKELKLKDLINSVKYKPGVAQQIKDSLGLGNLDDFEVDENELDNSDGGFVSDDVPDYEPYLPAQVNGEQQEEEDLYDDADLEDGWQEEIQQNYLGAVQNRGIPPKDKEEADEEDEDNEEEEDNEEGEIEEDDEEVTRPKGKRGLPRKLDFTPRKNDINNSSGRKTTNKKAKSAKSSEMESVEEGDDGFVIGTPRPSAPKKRGRPSKNPKKVLDFDDE
jgi:hypothetical protein